MEAQTGGKSLWQDVLTLIVDTTGKNERVIAEYIKNQLKEDEMSDQLTLNFEDPFTGSKK